MSLVAAMDALKDTFINAGLTGIDTDNCKVQDESVFNKLLTKEDDDYRRAILIGYEEMKRKSGSEFGGTLMCLYLSVTVFQLLWGDIDERAVKIRSCHQLIDEIFEALNGDSTLGGAVMDAAIVAGEPPMLYERQQMNDYMMITLIVEVTENIYGD